MNMFEQVFSDGYQMSLAGGGTQGWGGGSYLMGGAGPGPVQ